MEQYNQLGNDLPNSLQHNKEKLSFLVIVDDKLQLTAYIKHNSITETVA